MCKKREKSQQLGINVTDVCTMEYALVSTARFMCSLSPLITQSTAPIISAFPASITRKIKHDQLCCTWKKKNIKTTRIIKRRNNFILFPEACGFSAMNHTASHSEESCSGISLDWRAYSSFIVFVLDLTDVTCSLQRQHHLTEYKPNKSLAPSVDSTKRYPRPSWWTNVLQQIFGLKQIPRGKA